MRRSLLLAALAALCLPGATATAQNDTGLVKGRTEYNLFGNLQLNSPSSQTVNARWAPMVTDNWQLGADLSYVNADGSAGFIGGIANYYFRVPDARFMPYVGAAIGTTFGDVPDTTVWGFQIGAKHFLSPNAALGAEYQFRTARSEDEHQIVLGMSYFGGPSPLEQEFKVPDRGTTQYSANALLHFNPDYQMVNVGFAPWVNRNFQWGGEFNLNHGNDVTSGFIGGVANWHFVGANESRVQPYAGARIGTFFGDSDAGLAYDLHAGVLVFLAPDVAFNPEYSHRWTEFPGTTFDNDQISFGLVFLHR